MWSTENGYIAASEVQTYAETESQQMIEVQYTQQPKKSLLKWSWENLQKIVSLLTIIYFLALIFKITLATEVTPGLTSANFQDSHILDQKNQKFQTVPSVSDVKSAQNEINSLASSKNDGFIAKETEILKEQLSSKSKQTAQTLQSQSQTFNEGQPKNIRSDELIQYQKKDDFFLNAFDRQVLLRSSLRQVRQEQGQLQTAMKYQRFSRIYQEIDESLHKSVHLLSKQEKQQAISLYFKRRDHKNQFTEYLLAHNNDLFPQRTKKDELYLQELKEDYDFLQEGQADFCVIVSTQNNGLNGQINRTLNSIFNQQYKNYQLIISDSASSDFTISIISEYLLRNNKTNQAKIVQSQSNSRPFAILQAVQYCPQGSMVVMIDGNTELIGKEVFNIIDSEQRMTAASVLYADYYDFDVETNHFRHVKAHRYEESEKFMLMYRTIPKDYGKILVSRLQLIKNIPLEYISFNGKQYEYSGIDSIAFSLFELSCGKVKVINEPLVLSISDSSLQKEEGVMRQRQVGAISSKLKIDVC